MQKGYNRKHNDSFGRPDLVEKLKKIYCHIPFNEFHIYRGGTISNCCFNWLPTEVGNIHDQTLKEILNSSIQKKIQNSVLNGGYEFCSKEYCPHLNSYLNEGAIQMPLAETKNWTNSESLQKKIKIYLSFDYTCNLFCASCRNEKIFYTEQTAPQLLKDTYKKVYDQICELLESGIEVEVNITGSGDAFASPLYYKLMEQLPNNDGLTLHLSTNGTMMTEKKLMSSFKDKITKIFISVDSCREDVYEKIRRGGSFKVLEQNLKTLDRLISEGSFAKLNCVQYNVIVQEDNYSELGDFADWTKQFKNLNSIFFTKILDWEHLEKDSFAKKAIWQKDHPNHDKLIGALKDPRLNAKNIILGNLTEYRR